MNKETCVFNILFTSLVCVFSGGYFQLFGIRSWSLRVGGGVGPGDKTSVVPVS